MRRGMLAALLLSAVATRAAFPQSDIRQGIGRCSARAGELDRLSCYDSLARRLGFRQVLASRPAGAGRWRVDNSRNPLDDTPTVSLALVATSGQSRLGEPVVLFVRCESHKLEIFLAWNSYLGMDGAEVTTRIGSDSATTETWGNSSDNTASFYHGDAAALFHRLLAESTFAAQVTPYNESPITAVFNISGLRSAAAGIPRACPDVTLN